MLVLVTTKITKIQGIHPYKDGMSLYKTHVELRIIAYTHQEYTLCKLDMARTIT